MTYKLNPDLNTIDWNRIAALIDKVNWTSRTPEDLKVAFERGSFKVFVFNDSGEIIAFGRTVDDGRYYAQVADIVVDPEYHGQRIGELVVKELVDQLQDFNFITLTSSTDKADKFYRRIGWKKQSTAFIYPLSPKQLRWHVEPGE